MTCHRSAVMPLNAKYSERKKKDTFGYGYKFYMEYTQVVFNKNSSYQIYSKKFC